MSTFFNEDCISGAKKYIADNSIDLIISDPPYGIDGANLDKHYNRNENFVIDGYVEVPSSAYAQFSVDWIQQADRILKPGGTLYIVSGYTHLADVLNALKQTSLQELNHIIWKYNFGVYTKKKFVSSHYHILCYTKPGAPHTFNTYCRYADSERNNNNGSLNYQDREDVWIINREYKPGQVKNKNQLPTELLIKMIQYSSNKGDMVCDMFLGSFSTAKVAKGLNRKSCGFEISKNAFAYQVQQFEKLPPGYLLDTIRTPAENTLFNAGQPITDAEKLQIQSKYFDLKTKYKTKKQIIDILSNEFGRGRFSIQRILDDSNTKHPKDSPSPPSLL